MKNFALCFALLGASALAQANCIGGPVMQTCTDAAGNSYSVTRLGNTTMVNGRNAQTGSQWNQTSQTFGNTTLQTGTAANGRQWNSTTTTSGGMTSQFGRDSNGNNFRKTCGPLGCF
jgi:hypothetical protein